jgi:hypothetical protein
VCGKFTPVILHGIGDNIPRWDDFPRVVVEWRRRREHPRLRESSSPIPAGPHVVGDSDTLALAAVIGFFVLGDCVGTKRYGSYAYPCPEPKERFVSV